MNKSDLFRNLLHLGLPRQQPSRHKRLNRILSAKRATQYALRAPHGAIIADLGTPTTGQPYKFGGKELITAKFLVCHMHQNTLTLDPCGKAALIRDSRRSRRSADVRVRMPEAK